MKELIKIDYSNINKPTVLGRDLHKLLGIKTQYDIWFNRMVGYGFKINKDFVELNQKRLSSEGQRDVNREIINHQITFYMAEHIGMIQRNEIGFKIRDYFIKERDKLTNLLNIININKNSEEWQNIRKESKRARLEETDEIKRMIEYAKKNGSENADNYYTHFSKLIWDKLFLVDEDYKRVKNKTDLLDKNQLYTLMQGEYIVKKAINEGIEKEIDYHNIYDNAKNNMELLSSLIEITRVPCFEQLSMF